MKIDFSAFTEDAQDMAQRSYELARRYRHPMITREHVLLAFFETPDPKIREMFKRMGTDVDAGRKRLEFLVSNRLPMGAEQTPEPDKVFVSIEVKNFIDGSWLEAQRLGEKAISSPILFSGLIQSYFSGRDADRTITEILMRLRVDPGAVRKILLTNSDWEETAG